MGGGPPYCGHTGDRMSLYTQAPWRSVYRPGSRQRCAAVESASEGVYIFLNVAKHDDMAATIQRWKYDAELIAAAPELLEALKEILSLAKEWGKNPEYYTQAERNLIGFADAAIAKAEGK